MQPSKKSYKKYEKRKPVYRQRIRQPIRREVGYYEMLRYYTSNYDIKERRSISEYRSIIKKYIEFLIQKILGGKIIQLPCATGYIGITGIKNYKHLAPNWRETNKLWNKNEEAKNKQQIVYCLNHHTDGVRYKIRWYTRDVCIYNKRFYSFIPCRTFKRTVRDLIYNGKQFYVKNADYSKYKRKT